MKNVSISAMNILGQTIKAKAAEDCRTPTLGDMAKLLECGRPLPLWLAPFVEG